MEDQKPPKFPLKSKCVGIKILKSYEHFKIGQTWQTTFQKHVLLIIRYIIFICQVKL